MSKKRIATSVDHGAIVVIDSGEYLFPTNVGQIPNDRNIENHYASIQKSIAESNGEELFQLLSMPMQCSKVEYWEAAKIDMSRPETPYNYAERESGLPEGNTTFYLQVCPVVEGLALLYPTTYFFGLIDSLIKANNPALTTAFDSSLVETKGAMLAQHLYAWNPAIKAALEDGIADIGKHGAKLDKAKDVSSKIKGEALLELRQKLTNQLNHFVEDLDPKESPESNKLRVLRFKVGFTNTLHSKDNILGQHRGYAKIVSNIFSILFTGGLLNIVNYARTGKFWLYSTTRSQDQVAALNKITSIEQAPLLPVKVR